MINTQVQGYDKHTGSGLW